MAYWTRVGMRLEGTRVASKGIDRVCITRGRVTLMVGYSLHVAFYALPSIRRPARKLSCAYEELSRLHFLARW